MIRELKIVGFKMFTEVTFGMPALTVLAGMNGTGKTSVIHALLLVREISRQGSHIVQLNGPYELELSSFEDIQNWDTLESMRFDIIDDDNKEYSWVLRGNPTSLYAEVNKKPAQPPEAFNNARRMFQYLSAERFGPRNILNSAALPPDLLEVGVRGEFSAQVLYELASA